MASVASKVLEKMLTVMDTKNLFDKSFESGNFEKGVVKAPPQKLSHVLHIEVEYSQGQKVYILEPKSRKFDKTIFYLHGGGYIFGFQKIHWQLFEELIENLECRIVAPDYPIAPKKNFRDAYEMVEPVWKRYYIQAGKEKMIMMGDSAGGGFALGLLQKTKIAPSATILLSPWLDLSMDNPDMLGLEKLDPILSISGLQKAALSYAKGEDLHHPLLSPMYGEIIDFGDLHLYVGTKELFLVDVKKFENLCKVQEVKVNLHVYEEMLHDWPLYKIPESKIALKEMYSYIQK